jgi:hypothetical protein
VAAQSALVEVRDVPLEYSPASGEVIFMDLVTRNDLSLRAGQTYQFTLREVGWLRNLQWAWNACDPASRIAARLGVLGAIPWRDRTNPGSGRDL